MSFIKNIHSWPQSDEELVVLYKQSSDLNCLAQLYQRYMDLVYGVCLKYLKDDEDAKDSTLIIYEELVTKLQKHEVANFKSWLYQLAKNHCLMHYQQEQELPQAITIFCCSVVMQEKLFIKQKK